MNAHPSIVQILQILAAVRLLKTVEDGPSSLEDGPRSLETLVRACSSNLHQLCEPGVRLVKDKLWREFSRRQGYSTRIYSNYISVLVRGLKRVKYYLKKA